MASGSAAVLPANAECSYLDEGAANIVYRIHVRSPTPGPSEIEEYGEGTPPPSEIGFPEERLSPKELAILDNCLLRLRKDLPTTIHCSTSQASWARLIAPLFAKDQVVTQQLVRLPLNLIDRLNNDLKKSEETLSRASKRHGTYLANDGFGLLVEDMSADAHQTLFQFKPKWLLQSPSAPAGAKRCRTCAKNAQSESQQQSLISSFTRKLKSPKYFCPLTLLDPTPDDLRRISKIVLPASSTPVQVKAFSNWLQNTSLLKNIQILQAKLDNEGVFESDCAAEDFRLSMTLRDCTVFVRFDNDGKGEVEAKLGDLDLKSEDKVDYWRSLERELIDGGWYDGKNGDGGQGCLLSRH